MIKSQLEMIKDIALNMDNWVISIIFVYDIETVYGPKENTQGLCECCNDIIEMSSEYKWNICSILQCVIFTPEETFPIRSINGLKLSDFVKMLKEI